MFVSTVLSIYGANNPVELFQAETSLTGLKSKSESGRDNNMPQVKESVTVRGSKKGSGKALKDFQKAGIDEDTQSEAMWNYYLKKNKQLHRWKGEDKDSLKHSAKTLAGRSANKQKDETHYGRQLLKAMSILSKYDK